MSKQARHLTFWQNVLQYRQKNHCGPSGGSVSRPGPFFRKEGFPLTTNEKIAALRAAAKAAGADGVILMTSDPHSGEYLPAHYCSLTHFSGFTGENATLVVTGSGSALWVDGRFYVQADKQLAGTEIQSMHAGAAGVPTVEAYLKANAGEGQTYLTDGSCMPTKVFEQYRDALAACSATLKSADVVSPLWADDRPALPDTPCFLLSRDRPAPPPPKSSTPCAPSCRRPAPPLWR